MNETITDLINEAAETIYQLTSDEHIRLQREAREEYYRRQRTTQAIIDEQQEHLNQNAAQLTQNVERLAAKDEEIAALKARLAQLDK